MTEDLLEIEAGAVPPPQASLPGTAAAIDRDGSRSGISTKRRVDDVVSARSAVAIVQRWTSR
jgi:hypothetical protein